MMTTCPYCGTSVEKADEFCPTCGGALLIADDSLRLADGWPANSAGKPASPHDREMPDAPNREWKADESSIHPIPKAETHAGQQGAYPQNRGSAGLEPAPGSPFGKKALVTLVVIAAILALIACVVAIGAKIIPAQNSGSASSPANASADASPSSQHKLVCIDTKTAYFDEQGNPSRTVETNIDGHGSPLSRTMISYDTAIGEQTRVSQEEYELDDNGFVTGIKSTLNGTEQGWTHVDIEYGDHGLPQVETGEFTTKKYDYYPNGRVKSRVFRNDSYQETQEYDEKGLRLRTLHEEGGKTVSSTYVWEKDAEGNPTSCTVNSTVSTDDGKKSYQRFYTVKTNEFGEVDEIRDADTGTIRVEVQDYATMEKGSVSLYGQQRFTAPVPDEEL